jgi:hypothetical protein
MTKKQYRTPNVSVGTVKKSMLWKIISNPGISLGLLVILGAVSTWALVLKLLSALSRALPSQVRTSERLPSNSGVSGTTLLDRPDVLGDCPVGDRRAIRLRFLLQQAIMVLLQYINGSQELLERSRVQISECPQQFPCESNLFPILVEMLFPG